VSDDSASPLESALDELYAVDPSDFMTTRKRLVAELRAAGDAAGAKQLGAARRPTNAAWALNQLARKHAEVVDDFLTKSATLRDAQDRALSGKPDELRDATRVQREALATATEAANAVLGTALTETYRAQIASTLQAASVDEATAAALRQGRVIREVSGATGFPGFGAVSMGEVAPSTTSKRAPSRLPRARASSDASDTTDDGGKAREAREARARAESELASAEATWRDAEDAVTSAEEAAATADERVERARQELDDARREARAAADSVADARRAARDSTKVVERLRRTVEKLSEKES